MCVLVSVVWCVCDVVVVYAPGKLHVDLCVQIFSLVWQIIRYP